MPLDYQRTISAGTFDCKQEVFVNTADPMDRDSLEFQHGDYAAIRQIIDMEQLRNGVIRFTHLIRPIHVVNLHRVIHDLLDDPEFLDIQTPTERVTNNLIYLKNEYSIENRSMRILYGATIFDSTRGNVWTNIKTVGNLSDFNADEEVDSNMAFGLVSGERELWAYSANICNNIDILVKTVDNFEVLTDHLILRLRGRYGEYYIQPNEFVINCNNGVYQGWMQGTSVAALFYQPDINMPSLAERVVPEDFHDISDETILPEAIQPVQPVKPITPPKRKLDI